MKYISVLGSTGSIGTQTLDIVRNNKELTVVALAVYSNIVELEKQVREFSPEIVCVYDEKKAMEFKQSVSELPVKVVAGMEGLIECATIASAQVVVTAIVGMIGIRPTIAAIEAGKDIALANKETLVTAGHLIMPLIKKHGVQLLPVDSEHSAIFQCLQGENQKKLSRILLTASGGPFRGKSRSQLESIQVEDALKHPNWSMGRKITIDSATMVNKGLEVMEARWLFDTDFDHIQVLVHPQSIVHSMVEFEDGAVIAQLGTPDMRLPIQYALFYPDRMPLAGDRLDFVHLSKLTFEAPDMNTFSGLKLAYEVGRLGGSMPTVYNAANEMAVAKFLNREIPFLKITELIEKAIEHHKMIKNPGVEEILQTEQETYEFIESCK